MKLLSNPGILIILPTLICLWMIWILFPPFPPVVLSFPSPLCLLLQRFYTNKDFICTIYYFNFIYCYFVQVSSPHDYIHIVIIIWGVSGSEYWFDGKGGRSKITPIDLPKHTTTSATKEKKIVVRSEYSHRGTETRARDYFLFLFISTIIPNTSSFICGYR